MSTTRPLITEGPMFLKAALFTVDFETNCAFKSLLFKRSAPEVGLI